MTNSENTPQTTDNPSNGFVKRANNYQPNSITTSKQVYTLQEKRILSYIINQFNHKEVYEQDKNVRFRIPLSEISSHMNYYEIKSASLGLLRKEIKIENTENQQFMAKNLFTAVNYNVNNSGVLEMVLSADCVQEFVNLGKLYTRYNLDIFLSFKSRYSQRFYEILMLYSGRNQFEFTVNLSELKDMIDANNYKAFSDFRRKVLEVAQKEIAEKTEFTFEYSTNGKQRGIAKLTFFINSWKENAKEEVYNDVINFKNAPSKNQYNGIQQIIERFYQLRKDQVDAILASPTLSKKFVEIDSKINFGLINIKTSRSRYMAASLGIEDKQ